jgi:hypothetical protein
MTVSLQPWARTAVRRDRAGPMDHSFGQRVGLRRLWRSVRRVFIVTRRAQPLVGAG